jgi:dihydroneopterin aldolase
VSVTIHMFVADAGPSRSDDLADHVSYAEVVGRLRERAKSTRHVNLVETLAEEVAEVALADARVRSVLVDVRKTEIIPEAKGVGVIIHRRRPPGAG